MFLQDLIAEVSQSVLVHHASGHFTTEEATARLVANGMSETAAAELLAEPVDPALFDQYGTWPATDPRSSRYPGKEG